MSKSFPQQTFLAISLHGTAVFSRYAQTHSRLLSSIDAGENQQMSITDSQPTVVSPLKIRGIAYALAGRENATPSSIRHDFDTPNPLKNPLQTSTAPRFSRCNLPAFQPDSAEFPAKMPLQSTFSARDLF